MRKEKLEDRSDNKATYHHSRMANNNPFLIPNSSFLLAPLLPETRRLLDGIPALVSKTFPLPGRFRSALPTDVAELSRLLTSDRGERGLSYLGRPGPLSAYLRYFLPWNLYRLCRLLPGLDIALTANDIITDLGCGPLTFTAALWISRPDLRAVPLEFYCIDSGGPILEAGRKFFTALVGGYAFGENATEASSWKIHTVKGDITNRRFDTTRVKPAALVCAVNVFNEMYGDISRGGEGILRRNAEKSARIIEKYASDTASVFVAEPGFPRCGELISLLRGVFLERGRYIVSPCPHDRVCPFAGKERWCHFAFETKDAPPALQKLSKAAGFPKERAVLSFLFTGPVTQPEKTSRMRDDKEETVRIISDSFSLPYNRYGRYCCSGQGPVLLAGEKNAIEKTPSGALVNVIINKDKRDAKSGAIMAEIL